MEKTVGIRGLEQTYIYSNLNKNGTITNNIMELFSKGFVVTKAHIEEALMIISKNFKFPLKQAVLKDFEDGKLILRYGMTSKLPTCMPFFLTKSQGSVVAVISVDIYGSYDKDTDSIRIDPKKLYCMMEGAYLAKLIYFNANRIPTRSSIFATGSEIYSNIFTRVLNKKYALNVDKTKMHKVILLSSKFFMINIMGASDSDMVFNYAIKNCQNGNLYSLKEANDAFNPEAYYSFDKFINELATNKALGLNLKDLSVRGYLEQFINTYDSSTLFSLESFYYFVYLIICVIDGAYINNQFVLEDLVGNSGAKLYNELVKLDMN